MPNYRELNLNTGRVYGLKCQLDQTQEEAAELIQAISKYKRAVLACGQPTNISGPEAVANIVEEIVDVSIMLEQLCDLIQIPQSYFDEVYEKKVQRTLSRIDVQNREDGDGYAEHADGSQ